MEAIKQVVATVATREAMVPTIRYLVIIASSWDIFQETVLVWENESSMVYKPTVSKILIRDPQKPKDSCRCPSNYPRGRAAVDEGHKF